MPKEKISVTVDAAVLAAADIAARAAATEARTDREAAVRRRIEQGVTR